MSFQRPLTFVSQLIIMTRKIQSIKQSNIYKNPMQGNMQNFKQGTGQFYEIQSKSAGRVLDICQDKDRKSQLIIYSSYAGKNQQFSIVNKGLFVNFISKLTNKYLTVGEFSDKNGAIIHEQPYNGQENQLFRLQPLAIGSKEFIIFTFCGKVFDCCEDKTSNGTSIIQWDFHSKSNQKWIINKV